MFLAFILVGKHHTYFFFFQNRLWGGGKQERLRFFAFYRPNGYVIHSWDFGPEMGHLFYRFCSSNSMCSVTALCSCGGEGGNVPEILVLAPLSSSTCGSWSDTAPFQRK